MAGRARPDRTLRLVGGVSSAEQRGSAHIIEVVGSHWGARLDRLSRQCGKDPGWGGRRRGGGCHHRSAQGKGGDSEETSAGSAPSGTLSKRAGGTRWFRGAAEARGK